MQTQRSSNRPNPYLFALLLGLLSGCSASASISAGASSDLEHGDQDVAETSGSEMRESNAQASGAALSQDEGSASSAGELEQPKEHGNTDETTVATADPVVAAPPPHTADPASVGGGDHDRGHGNDQDGVDEDNPGKSKQAAKKKAAKKSEVTAASDGDHDRGHGNDQDGVDEDNPGKSKKGK